MPSNSTQLSQCGLRDELAEPLRDALLYKGGPVCTGNLYVLHSCPGVENAYPVLEEVYTGGLYSTVRLVKEGEADARQFKMLSGYCGWKRGQLEDEIASGSWYVLSASSDVVKSALQSSRAGFGMGSALNEKKSMWQDMLQLAGIDPTIYPRDSICQ
eukprot:jgi/Botrbrau1/18902/Bobra.177_2s0060.1